MYCIRYWFEVSGWLACCKCYSSLKTSCTTCSTWNPMKNGEILTGARRMEKNWLFRVYIYRGFYCPVLWGGSLSTNQYFIESIPRVFGPWLRRWISDAFFGVLTGFSSPLDHQEDDVLTEFGGLKGSGLNRNQQNDRNIQAILGLSLSWWCFLIDSIHHGIHHHVSPSFGRHFFPTTQPANPNFPYSFLIPTLTPSR